MKIYKPVAIVFLVIINVMMAFLFVIPEYQKSSDLQVNLVKKQLQYDGQRDYYREVLAVRKEIEQRKDILTKVDSALPPDLYLAPIMYFFQKKTLENQLTLNSVTFSKSTAGMLNSSKGTREIKSAVFFVTVSGSYQSLKKLLAVVDASARLFEVQTIAFSSEKPLPQEGLALVIDQFKPYNFKLEIKTYFY